MVIKLNSLSFSQIQSSLINYFNNQTDADKWRDFYESSTGRFFIRLLSAFGSFVSYLNVVNRREAYLTYAENRSSLIGISQNLGYSVKRGSNEIVEIKVLPTFTLLIPAYTVVGSIKNQDLITVEDVQLNNAVSSNIKLCIGKISEEEIIIDTDRLRLFRFISKQVSSFFRLKLNDTLLPTSRNLRDLSLDKYVAISNPLGSIDVFYLQEGSYKYSPSDVLTLQYIVLGRTSYELNNIIFNYGSVLDIISNIPYEEPESTDSIRINAPLYHETQVLIRGRNDYLKEFKNLGYGLTSTSGFDFSPAIVELSYCRDNLTVLKDNEKSSILSSLDGIRSFGVPLPRITHPNHLKLELDFNIKKQSNTLLEKVDVFNDIEALASYYTKSLKPSVDLESLEHDIEDFSYVKRARVNIHTTDRTNNTYYRLGDFIKSPIGDNKIYMCRHITKKSGSIEPSWLYSINDEIDDGSLVWRCIPKYLKETKPWYPNRNYKVGDIVKSTEDIPEAEQFLFECVHIKRYSGSTIPTFTNIIKEFTEDRNLIWVCKNKVNSDGNWTANTSYKLGDSIQQGDFSYEVIGFRAKTQTSLPKFKITDSYPIVAVSNVSPYKFTIAGDYTSFININDSISVRNSVENNGYYTVTNVALLGGNTVITVQQPIISNTVDGDLYLDNLLTLDGDLLWEYKDKDDVIFNYSWKDYLVIKNNITII